MGEGMTAQLTIWDYNPPIPNLHCAGETFNPAFDIERLGEQQRRVWDVMKDGEWRTLRQIARLTDDPEASISARLRAFNGNDYLRQHFVMSSERMPGLERRGVWRYRVQMRGP
jgi:hypothetical protein